MNRTEKAQHQPIKTWKDAYSYFFFSTPKRLRNNIYHINRIRSRAKLFYEMFVK